MSAPLCQKMKPNSEEQRNRVYSDIILPGTCEPWVESLALKKKMERQTVLALDVDSDT